MLFLTLMTRLFRFTCLIALLALVAGCTLKDDTPPPGEKPSVPAPADVAAPPADAIKTPSGLASKVLRVGLGRFQATLKSTVTIHYTGWTTDGKMFDTSTGGQPFTVPMLTNGRPTFIAGWMEALQLMREGERRRVWIPGNLAYDNLPDPPGRPNPKGMLVFDIEMIAVR